MISTALSRAPSRALPVVLPFFLMLMLAGAARADDPPVANATATPSTVEGSQPLVLDGTGSTDDAGIVEYRWAVPDQLYTFDGTVIAPEWSRVGAVSQSNRLLVTGHNSWTRDHFFSVPLRIARGGTLEGRVDTAADGHGMFGLKNPDTSSGHYNTLRYCIYLAAGLYQVFEDGLGRGYVGSYTPGNSYDLRIVTKAGGGAKYYARRSGVGDAYSLLYDSSYGTAAEFTIGATCYSGTWGFDNFKVDNVNVAGAVAQTTAPAGGTMTLTVTDGAGQSDSDTVSVTNVTGNAPVANISAPSTATAGTNVQFDPGGSTDDYGIAGYSWDFGDGATYVTQSSDPVQHFYGAPGVYTVRLTVVDYADQTGTTTHSIEVTGSSLVQAVPWRVVGGVEIPHETWSGRTAVLKAVAGHAAVPLTWTWDFGDGSPTLSGTATTTDQAYALQAKHAYTGSEGTPFTARITVTDANGTTAIDTYPLLIRQKSLEVEMNVAIDEGLWYLHRTLSRRDLSGGIPGGYWTYNGNNSAPTGSSIQAFGINGHRLDGDADRDPYVETVMRAVNDQLTMLTFVTIGSQTWGDPDTNGNGIGLHAGNNFPCYELGQVMDGLIAAVPPDWISQAGGVNVKGRPYRDIVQDMVDMYCWGQADYTDSRGGGWRYSWNADIDNSAAQWGAIGCKAAEDVWNLPVPQWVKDRSLVWLNYSNLQWKSGGTLYGGFGYGAPGSGPATTPGGMVQLAWVGIPRTDARWYSSENWIADNWADYVLKNNLYAMYALTKALRLQSPPVTQLALTGKDWFLDDTDGFARLLVDRQYADGHFASSVWVEHSPLATAWAINILSSSLFREAPVAVAHAQPNPGAVGQDIHFDATGTYHQDPTWSIVQYLWDFDASDGIDFDTPDAVGATPRHAYGALGTYTVTLQVKDNNTPPAYDTATLIIQVTVPPHPPTAVAGGPYVAAVGENVQFDGSGSFDIDASEGDSITAYDWEVDFVHPLDFSDGVSGVNANWSGGPGAAGSFDIGLRVTDDTVALFPKAGSPDLTDDDFTTLVVYPRVITDLYARPKGSKIQLVWTHLGGNKTYRVYRSTAGPNRGFTHLATTQSTYSTFLDTGLPLNTTFYYRIMAFDTPAAGAPLGDPLGSSSTVGTRTSSRDPSRNRDPRFTSVPPTTARVGEQYVYDPTCVDAEQQTLTYNLGAGPAGMSCDASTCQVTFTPTLAQLGVHDVFLEARDPQGGLGTQFYQLVVSMPPNTPPVAVVNGPHTIMLGSSVSFSSAGTQDPDGDPMTWYWNFGDGNTSTAADPVHTYGAAGYFVVTLFVSDDRGGTTSAQTTVQVDRPNRLPVAVIKGHPVINVRLGAQITLDGSDSYDLDGDPLTYTWQWGDSTPADTSAVPGHTYGALGTYHPSLTVGDGQGGLDVVEITVNVGSENQPPLPVIEILQAGDDVGEEYVFDGSGSSDPESDLIALSWDFGDGSGTTGESVSHAYTQGGDYIVTLTVEDEYGAVAETTVAAWVNAEPAFTTTPGTSVDENELYTYSATAVDPEGEAVTMSLEAGPAGMTFDPTTWEIRFTPDDDQVGDHDVTLRATDPRGAWSEQSFTLTVQPVDDAPVITPPPAPLAIANPGVPYTYQVEASDADPGDSLTYALVSPPTGMTIGSSTGTINWTPAAGQTGVHTITVQVSDGVGAPVVLSWQIHVTTADTTVPDVIGWSRTNAEAAIVTAALTVGTVTTVNHATVPAGTVISQSPIGGSMVANGFAVDLTVSLGPVMVTVPNVVGLSRSSAESDIVDADLAVGPVTISYHDTVPEGEVLSQSPTGGSSAPEHSAVNLVVSAGPGVPDDEPPLLTARMDNTTGIYAAGGPVGVRIDASDNSGVVNLSVSVDGGPALPATPGHTALGTFAIPGSGHTVVVTATDPAGNVASMTLFFGIFDPTDTTPPTATILEPTTDTAVTNVTDVNGIASDINLLVWKLEVAPIGTTVFTVFATGNTPVLAGLLGRFDPTVMINGQYTIRLTVIDCNGVTATSSIAVYVEGNLKLGHFWTSFKDKSLDLGSFPLQIHRDYDSRRRTVPGEFGYGWKLGLSEAELTLNLPVGQGWQQFSSGGFFTTYTLSAPRPHIVSIKIGRDDDEKRQFVAVPDPESQQIVPIQFLNGMDFEPLGGTVGTLQPIGQTAFVYQTGYIYDSGFELFNPPGYVYTAPDGWIYTFSRTSGGSLGIRQTLTAVTDPNGTTMSVTAGGITRSDGLAVQFVKDAQGRITELTDPRGNVVTYEYDSRGDLVAVTDPEGNTTHFVYDSNHYLLEIIDPLGRPVQRQEYDDDGRLISITDAHGEQVELEYDLTARTQIVRDRRGNPVVYEYDSRGNVVNQTDFPTVDGVVTAATIGRTYDLNGDKLSETDQLGHTTHYTYDARGNLLAKTDPDGGVEAFTYNSRDQVLTHMDPRGNLTSNIYDALGRVTSRTARDGGITSFTYDSRGNVLTRTDPLGNVTTYTYDTLSRRLTETEAPGYTTSWTWDANGNKLTETDPLGNITRFEWDRRDLLTAKVGPGGARTEYVYNANGFEIAVIDPLGHRTEQTLDDRGYIVRTDFPDGTFETSGFDEDGNRISRTNRNGATTHFEFDALDRLTRIIGPDSTVRELRYDAAGNLIGEIDERGVRTDHGYDDLRRRKKTIAPTGDETTFEYDANGNRIALTDAIGNRTDFAFDAMDRPATTTLPGGVVTTVTYDLLGRVRTKTDGAGYTTEFEYDAVGNLVRVTDPLGNETSYAYDAVGNRVSVEDANGHVTGFEYDASGRMTARDLPGGQRETFTWDAAGRKTGHTDFNGASHSFTYDAVGRRLTASYADGTRHAWTYTGEGAPLNVKDARGVTSNSYDDRGNLLTATDPSGRTTAYTYTPTGEVETVTSPTGKKTSYGYDPLDRLATATDPDGGVTTYAYDGVGNLVSTDYPNGTRAEYGYNVRNQLIHLANRRSDTTVFSSYDYTLDSRGLRMSVAEAGGGVNYTYDASGRLLSEVRTGANAFTASYTYDRVGNRLSVNRGGVITNYAYDTNDRLTSDGTLTWSYDNNGNLTSAANGGGATTYSYDSLNRLVATTSPAAGTTRYAYDADGNRVALQDGAGNIVTEYLLDVISRTGVVQVLEELDAAGTTRVHYTYGGDLISQKRGATRSTYHYDGLGSTRDLTNATQTVTDTYLHDAYGRALASTGTTVNDYRFAGEQLDAATGFTYLRARYYAPDQGRFVSMDPEMGDPQAPISLHRYLYAASNPVNYIDPTGRFAIVSLLMSTKFATEFRMTYTKNLMSFFTKAVKIAFCIVQPGAEMRNAGLRMIADGLPGGVAMYTVGNSIVIQGLEAIRSEIKETYKGIAEDVFHVKFITEDELKQWVENLRSGNLPRPPGYLLNVLEFYDQTIHALEMFAEALQDIDALIDGNNCQRFSVIAKRINLVLDNLP